MPVCPEVAAGMPVPRQPAEIVGGDGSLVLTGKAPILDITQNDVTEFFITGAHKALSLAQKYCISIAILKDGSPSCGSTYIYDGTFTKKRKPGRGVTAALLKKFDIRGFNERQTGDAAQWYGCTSGNGVS